MLGYVIANPTYAFTWSFTMYLYKIDIPATGMSYIGKTTISVEHRFKQHCNPKNPSLISKAIKHYGDPVLTTLYKASSIEELDKVELDAIRRFNTEFPNGYNLVSGPGSEVAMPKETKKKKSSGGRTKNEHLPPIILNIVGNVVFKTQAIKRQNTYIEHIDKSVMKGTLRHGVRSIRSGQYHISGSFDFLPYIENKLGPHHYLSSQNCPSKCWTLTKEQYDDFMNFVVADLNKQ
jgi:hypothetical protein